MNPRRAIILVLVSGLFCLVPLGATAEEKPVVAANAGEVIYPQKTGARMESSADRGTGYTAVLVAALLMAGVGGWTFWRARAAPGGGPPLRKLAIAETKSLGNRQYLVVATYEERKFLLGVCPGRIDLLTPLDSPGAVEKTRP